MASEQRRWRVTVMVAGIAFLMGIGTSRIWDEVASDGDGKDDGPGIEDKLSRRGSLDREFESNEARGTRSRLGEDRGFEMSPDRIRLAFNNSDPISRQIAFAQLLGEADASSIADIRAMFLEFDRSGLTYDNEWRMLWHHWGTLDPEVALAQLRKEIAEGGAYGFGPQVSIFSAWASEDPEGAQEAMREIEDAPEFEASYFGVIRGMPLEEATRFAASSTFDDDEFASRIAENLTDRKLRESNSVADLKDWYGGLDGSLRKGALDHVYWRIRTADFADAAAWIHDQSVAGEDTRRIAAEMADAFLQKGDLTGLSWYLELPAGSQSSGKFREWSNRVDIDSDAYREWAALNVEASQEVEANRSGR